MMKRKKLIIARKRKNLSQKTLGTRVGISRQTIIDYESGRYMRMFDIMKKISDELECSVDELFF
jgi:DNA-binding XRE family transcriptional regulator